MQVVLTLDFERDVKTGRVKIASVVCDGEEIVPATFLKDSHWPILYTGTDAEVVLYQFDDPEELTCSNS